MASSFPQVKAWTSLSDDGKEDNVLEGLEVCLWHVRPLCNDCQKRHNNDLVPLDNESAQPQELPSKKDPRMGFSSRAQVTHIGLPHENVYD